MLYQYSKTLVSRGVSTAQAHPSLVCYEDTLNSVYFPWGIGCSLTQYGGNRLVEIYEPFPFPPRHRCKVTLAGSWGWGTGAGIAQAAKFR